MVVSGGVLRVKGREPLMSAEAFGRRLRELREEAGLTQKQLAEKAGLSQRGIANWELGLREPLWSNAVALAAALGVEVGAFLQPPGEPKEARVGRPPKKPEAEPEPKKGGKKKGSKGGN